MQEPSTPGTRATDAFHPKDAPVVSVVIPVYNVRECLGETLNSIANQSFTDWECICVDDGSTDGSADIVRLYAERDHRFRLVSQRNSGAAAARNRGIDEARGEFLLFVDGDDLIAPSLMSICAESMRRDQSELCAFGANSFYSDSNIPDKIFSTVPAKEGEESSIFHPNEMADCIFVEILAPPWNKMYRIDFLRQRALRFPCDLNRSEDTPFGIWCLAEARKVTCVNRQLYRYRQSRKDSQTQSLASPDVYLCYLDAAKSTWAGLRSREKLKTYGIGALRCSLDNALYYQGMLIDRPRLYIDTRRLIRFVRNCLRELHCLGVQPNQFYVQEIERKTRKFRRISRKKVLAWFKKNLRAYFGWK